MAPKSNLGSGNGLHCGRQQQCGHCAMAVATQVLAASLEVVQCSRTSVPGGSCFWATCTSTRHPDTCFAVCNDVITYTGPPDRSPRKLSKDHQRKPQPLTGATTCTLSGNTCRPGPSPARLTVCARLFVCRLHDSQEAGVVCSRKHGLSLLISCTQHSMAHACSVTEPLFGRPSECRFTWSTVQQ